MPPSRVREFDVAADGDVVIELLAATLGASDKHSEAIHRWGPDPDALALVATNKRNEAVGIGVARTERRPASECFSEFSALPPAFASLHPIGMHQILAMKPEYRRAGTGLAMGKALETWMSSRGCAALFGVCWEHGRRDGSRSLFIADGFRKVSASPGYYLRMRTGAAGGCPCCDGECSCSATLFAKSIV
jgi:GNAT superfamily N-acetyltransferase